MADRRPKTYVDPIEGITGPGLFALYFFTICFAVLGIFVLALEIVT